MHNVPLLALAVRQKWDDKSLALALVDALQEEQPVSKWTALREVVALIQAGRCDAEWAEAAELIRIHSKWYLAIRETVRARLGWSNGVYFGLSIGPGRQRITTRAAAAPGESGPLVWAAELKPRFVIGLHRQMLLQLAKQREERDVVARALGRGPVLRTTRRRRA